ncbi:MAG: nicotinate-nucleotide diphosphorylase (carboxylating), partial [Myxococcales bacterium]|nr:nicotinate-nucleotide diphosphorylase (carboxylating) [Myxococcales bacterium]
MLLRALMDPLIERALYEDLAGGDLSAEACVEPERRATANALVKASTVVCGGAVFRRVFEVLDADVRFEERVPDGTLAAKGTLIWSVEGRARSLLMAERTALNFVQRMSGTASLARKAVDALPPGSKTRIADTRKTTPGLRYLERYAVRTGGAHNHR